jgi:hypothetical protein
LARGAFAGGWHAVSWGGADRHGRQVSAGVYEIRFHALGEVRTQKLVWMPSGHL